LGQAMGEAFLNLHELSYCKFDPKQFEIVEQLGSFNPVYKALRMMPRLTRAYLYFNADIPHNVLKSITEVLENLNIQTLQANVILSDSPGLAKPLFSHFSRRKSLDCTLELYEYVERNEWNEIMKNLSEGNSLQNLTFTLGDKCETHVIESFLEQLPEHPKIHILNLNFTCIQDPSMIFKMIAETIKDLHHLEELSINISTNPERQPELDLPTLTSEGACAFFDTLKQTVRLKKLVVNSFAY